MTLGEAAAVLAGTTDRAGAAFEGVSTDSRWSSGTPSWSSACTVRAIMAESSLAGVSPGSTS